MVKKLFIVGHPGSGKSAIARFIERYVPMRSQLISDRIWATSRINDYLILDSMYRDDKGYKRFEPAEPSGFIITDFSAFNDALKNLGQWIASLILEKKGRPDEILIIEFARNDYRLAFAQFDKDFLRDAYFIYLGVDEEICKQRIQNRIIRPEYEDDYPVSDEIFRTYYYRDNGRLLSQILALDFEIDKQRVLAFDNNCMLEEAKKKVCPFIDSIINPETVAMDVEDPLAEENTTSIIIGGWNQSRGSLSQK